MFGDPQEPESYKQNLYDSNDILIPFKLDHKKGKAIKIGQDEGKHHDSGI